MRRGADQEFLVLWGNRGQQILNEASLKCVGLRFGYANGRNPYERSIRNDPSQPVFQLNELTIKHTGSHFISDPHPIGDGLEPWPALSDQSLDFKRVCA